MIMICEYQYNRGIRGSKIKYLNSCVICGVCMRQRSVSHFEQMVLLMLIMKQVVTLLMIANTMWWQIRQVWENSICSSHDVVPTEVHININWFAKDVDNSISDGGGCLCGSNSNRHINIISIASIPTATIYFVSFCSRAEGNPDRDHHVRVRGYWEWI